MCTTRATACLVCIFFLVSSVLITGTAVAQEHYSLQDLLKAMTRATLANDKKAAESIRELIQEHIESKRTAKIWPIMVYDNFTKGLAVDCAFAAQDFARSVETRNSWSGPVENLNALERNGIIADPNVVVPELEDCGFGSEMEITRIWLDARSGNR